MKSWEYYITKTDLESVLSEFNSNVGASRQSSFEAIDEVATTAAAEYGTLDSVEEIQSAILWDVNSFLEYATTGITASASEIRSKYLDLLPAGHPETVNPSLSEYAAWVAGAPELFESDRDAIVASIKPSDEFQNLHANVRLVEIAKQGRVSQQTADLIADSYIVEA